MTCFFIGRYITRIVCNAIHEAHFSSEFSFTQFSGRLRTFENFKVKLDGPVVLDAKDAVEGETGEVVGSGHHRTDDEASPTVPFTR